MLRMLLHSAKGGLPLGGFSLGGNIRGEYFQGVFNEIRLYTQSWDVTFCTLTDRLATVGPITDQHPRLSVS